MRAPADSEIERGEGGHAHPHAVPAELGHGELQAYAEKKREREGKGGELGRRERAVWPGVREGE